MGAGLANAEDKKQDSTHESASESPQLAQSRFTPSGRGAWGDSSNDSPNGGSAAGAPSGMPLFLRPQVQMKCAECAKEEEEEQPQPPIQKKCAHCEAEEKRRREQGEAPVQAKCATCEAEGLKEKSSTGSALDGVSNANQPLPHLDRIQASFGRHDVSGVRAAVGGNAAEASGRMGALAYTSGDRVAFRNEPDVNLAAHEAAHTVQQRNGAKLPGGVGRPGDGYEQQADAAASAVERGESAEPILDRGVSSDSGGDSGGGSAPAVQHRLAVNAFRMYEPPALATHVALSTPRGGDQQERGGAVKQGPRQGTAQSGQSAIAQADQGASPVPATQAGGAAPAPAGGAEAQTSAPAGFNPHCYNADYDEPADDSGDEPQDDKKTTESKEEIHPDLPRPDETDNCPIETAISAQTPVAAAPPAGQQVSASATPAAAGNTPAQAAAPAATPGPNAEAGAITAALHADGSKIQDNAHAAASAPSPLEGAIAQAEAGRDTAVSSFQDSGATTRVLAPRIGALSSDVRFLPETSDGAGGEGRAGETRISDFFGNAANRLDQALTFASDVAPDRLGDTAESMKGNIAAGIEQQKTSLSANIESARLQAFSSAESARADIHAEHRATTTAIEAQTSAAMDTLTAAHQDTIDSIQETETDALDGVNALYRTSYDAHVALGPEYADRADARGEQYAEFYQGCKRYNEDGTEWKDGFFAGYLTNRRAEAEVKAARETAKGYRKSLTETANDQAAQAMKGRRKDRCGIIATARRTRTSVDDHLTTLMGRLERGRQESIAQAGNTRDTMLAHINSGLNSALAVLDLLSMTEDSLWTIRDISNSLPSSRRRMPLQARFRNRWLRRLEMSRPPWRICDPPWRKLLHLRRKKVMEFSPKPPPDLTAGLTCWPRARKEPSPALPRVWSKREPTHLPLLIAMPRPASIASVPRTTGSRRKWTRWRQALPRLSQHCVPNTRNRPSKNLPMGQSVSCRLGWGSSGHATQRSRLSILLFLNPKSVLARNSKNRSAGWTVSRRVFRNRRRWRRLRSSLRGRK
jgi:hypothetical protein